jgi:hypothetical protein
MARLTQPNRSQFTDPDDLEAYDAVVERQATLKHAAERDPALDAPALGGYWGGLLTSPTMCAIAARMGAFMRTAGDRESSFSHAEREFVDQVLSADWKTNVVQSLHVRDAIATGVRMEAVEALRFGHEEDLDEHERLLARYIRQVISGTVDDATFDSLASHFGKRGLLEYTGFVLWLQWIIRMMQVIGVNDPDDAEIDELIEGLKQGSVQVSDFRERIG